MRVPDRDPALSRFWARNRGLSEAAALANLLKSLRKVAGYLGENTGQVIFPGMAFPERTAIMIDPTPARQGSYPIDFHTIDFLSGEVVREALRRTEWSGRVWKLLAADIREMSGKENVAFQKLVYAGEEIYVDLVAARSMAGLYAGKARQKALAECLPPGSHIHSPSLDELMYLWMKNYKSGVDEKGEYGPLLFSLKAAAVELKNIAGSHAGQDSRCQKRAGLYRGVWEDIGRFLLTLKVIDKTLYFYPAYGGGKAGAKGTGRGNADAAAALPPELRREMEVYLAADTVDITPVIWSVAGYDNPDVVRMSRWDFNRLCRPVIDRRLVARLKAIFANYSPRRKIASRGLSAGRIDPRRLYRAPVTGRCFKEVYRVPEDSWQITLLVDASGSMRGNKMYIVENTVANLNKALGTGRNRLAAYAYFEVNKICMFSRMLKDGRLFSVPPAGKTASGQAIIAATWLMDRGGGRKRNLLIHITDGESNFGCDVSCGIDYCRREGVNLITLGCGCKDREAMEAQYGDTIQFLRSYENLPRALEHLFKRIFLYGRSSTKSL